jgi:hypothetical protein
LGNVYFDPVEDEREALKIVSQICSFCATALAQLNKKNMELEVDYLRFSQENQEFKQVKIDLNLVYLLSNLMFSN